MTCTAALVRVNQSHLGHHLAHQLSRPMHFCSTAAISDQSSWKKTTLSSQRRPNVIDWNNHCTPGVLLDSGTSVAFLADRNKALWLRSCTECGFGPH